MRRMGDASQRRERTKVDASGIVSEVESEKR
jgi:hypothetical protein